jgi:hypothetical protein
MNSESLRLGKAFSSPEREVGEMFKRRGTKHKSTQIVVVWMTTTLALGMMGIGIAAWQDGVEVFGVVSTGDIDPVFTSVSPIGRGDAFVIDNQKTINISIDDACPGEVFKCEYTVTNRGSVPVSLHFLQENTDSGVRISNHFPKDCIGANGDSAGGTFMIWVGEDVEPSATYSFYLTLVFRQLIPDP